MKIGKCGFSLILVYVLLWITGCVSPSPSDHSLQTKYEFEGFSLASKIIPDWTERRNQSFKRHIRTKDGKTRTIWAPKSFECSNARTRTFEISYAEKGVLKVQIQENVALQIPAKLKNQLALIREQKLIENVQFQFREGPQTFLEFPDGWYAGFSWGEWGGMLLWVGRDGSHQVITKINTNDLKSIDDRIFVAQGVNHLDTNSETILVFNKGERPSTFKGIVAPAAIDKLSVDKGRVIGLMSYGVIYSDENQTVHYHYFSKSDRLGFKPKNLGFLPSGGMYLSGINAIAVYPNLPKLDKPIVLVPDDCEVIFESSEEANY